MWYLLAWLHIASRSIEYSILDCCTRTFLFVTQTAERISYISNLPKSQSIEICSSTDRVKWFLSCQAAVEM